MTTSRNALHRLHTAQARARLDPPTGTLIVWRDGDGVEHTRTWPNALPRHKTPCRVDSTKGIHQHRCSPAHRDAVQGYQSWREAEYEAAEAATNGYATELAEYWLTHTPPTFKAYLQGMRDETRDETPSNAA